MGQRSALNHELRTLPDYVLDDIGINQHEVRVVNFGGLTAWLRAYSIRYWSGTNERANVGN